MKLFSVVLRRLVLAAVTLASMTAIAQENLRKVTIGHDSPEELSREFRARGFDVLEGSVTARSLDLIVSTDEYRTLTAPDFGARNWHIISIELGQPLRNLTTFNTSRGAIPNGYSDLAQINQQLVNVASAFTNITQLVNLTQTYGVAQTFEGRDIFALKISDNPELDEDEPSLLVVSTHHAREIVTPVIALDAINRLTMGYGSDPAITSAVNDNTIWIAPIWNPDGYNEVINGDNFWRKNRRVFATGIGVDQNRNYPTGWDSPCGGSTTVSSQTHRGPAPGSEPETQLMMVWSEDQRFTKVIDYHSSGREVLFGYSCSSHPFTSYFENEAIDLSLASGYFGDNRPAGAEGEHYQWQLARYGSWSHLIETATTFQPTFASAQMESDRVWPGILHALDRPVPLTGLVTDANTSLPVEASIVFSAVNFNLGEQFASNPRFGRYYLFAPAGPYTLQFSADGYVSQSIEVDLQASAATLNVQLVPDSIDTDGDGVDDTSDNCLLVANPAQIDADGDGFGNVCDADINGDCTVNFLDVAVISDGFLGADPVLDLSGDGVVNFVDVALIPNLFLAPPGPSGLIDACP